MLRRRAVPGLVLRGGLGGRTDIVLPGRQKEGSIINIVLDTSGSMSMILPAVLGMIQSFGRSAGAGVARIVECDMAVTSDEVVDIDELSSYRMVGYGGSSMTPGMLRMAEDQGVESVLVITDGFIDIPPAEQVPYDVLWWILTWDGDASHFNPPYGRVVGTPINECLSVIK